MTTTRGGTWVIRSLLFVPAHREDLIAKASRSGADCLALDLQDATPADEKAEARKTVRKALESGLFQRKRVLVRFNHPDTGLAQDDLDGVACAELDGFVYPMVSTAQEIVDLDGVLSRKEQELGLGEGHLSLLVLIETPLGLLNAHTIATASTRVKGLIFGAEDYLAEVQGQYDAQNLVLHVPRSLVVIAARAVGVEAIDTPYLQVHDLEGLRTHAEQARALGMSGMLALSPRQIPVVHAVYTPSDAEVQAAQDIVQMAAEARKKGASYMMQGGQLVAPSGEKKAHKVLARLASIRALELSLSDANGG